MSATLPCGFPVLRAESGCHRVLWSVSAARREAISDFLTWRRRSRQPVLVVIPGDPTEIPQARMFLAVHRHRQNAVTSTFPSTNVPRSPVYRACKALPFAFGELEAEVQDIHYRLLPHCWS